MAIIEAIATTYCEADVAEAGITFSSIPQTYERLQLRGQVRFQEGTGTDYDIVVRFNTVTSTVYSVAKIYGYSSGTTGSANQYYNRILAGKHTGNGNDSHNYNSFIMDIYDYANTNKNAQCTIGWAASILNSPSVGTAIALYGQTTAISSVNVYVGGYGFTRGSVVSLYGIKSS